MDKKLTAILWLFWGCVSFLAFAYDIENGRDFFTWVWLLTSQLALMKFLIIMLKDNS